MIKTVITFDLSKLREFPIEISEKKIRGACLREMTKLGFESQKYQWHFIDVHLSDLKMSELLPESLKMEIFSKAPMSFTPENRKLELFEAHTSVPVTYSVEEWEGQLNAKKVLHADSSDYMKRIIGAWDCFSLESLRDVSYVFKHMDCFLTFDQKFEQLLKRDSLIDQIRSRYDFFYQAIQAYQENSFHSILPEAWPVKDIMSLIREGSREVVSLFSMLCIKLQYEKFHGETVSNNLVKEVGSSVQQKPMHIGLFDTYRVYLDTMKSTVHRIKDTNPNKKKCVDLLKGIEIRLENFIAKQLNFTEEINVVKQNAWLNRLIKIKYIFQWTLLKEQNFREKKCSYPDLKWIPFSFAGYTDQNYVLERSEKASKASTLSEKIINFYLERCLSDAGFDVECHMQRIEEEVSNGVYFFATMNNHESDWGNLKDYLNPNPMFPCVTNNISGVGCHLELSEELSARDLIIMSYISLTPVGHFMPLYSFHDGAWHDSFWLRGHDPFHEGRFVRTFERIGCKTSNPFISRYSTIDKMDNYFALIHKILTALEKDSGILEEEKNCILLHLFESHELNFVQKTKKDLDLLDEDVCFDFFQIMPDQIDVYQDLLWDMNIQIEDHSKTGESKIILPGRHELRALEKRSFPIYQKLKRNALVEFINEKFLMDAK